MYSMSNTALKMNALETFLLESGLDRTFFVWFVSFVVKNLR